MKVRRQDPLRKRSGFGPKIKLNQIISIFGSLERYASIYPGEAYDYFFRTNLSSVGNAFVKVHRNNKDLGYMRMVWEIREELSKFANKSGASFVEILPWSTNRDHGQAIEDYFYIADYMQ